MAKPLAKTDLHRDDEQLAMTGHITINILGPFEAVGTAGEKLAVRSRRSRALLACLAMEMLRKDFGFTAPDEWGNDPFVCLPKRIRTDIELFRSAISRDDGLRAASVWHGQSNQNGPPSENQCRP